VSGNGGKEEEKKKAGLAISGMYIEINQSEKS
jgi:hypothetical protein